MVKFGCVIAKEEMHKHLSEIDTLLEDITIGIGRYKAQRLVNWEHSGGAAHIEGLLTEVYQFIYESED